MLPQVFRTWREQLTARDIGKVFVWILFFWSIWYRGKRLNVFIIWKTIKKNKRENSKVWRNFSSYEIELYIAIFRMLLKARKVKKSLCRWWSWVFVASLAFALVCEEKFKYNSDFYPVIERIFFNSSSFFLLLLSRVIFSKRRESHDERKCCTTALPLALEIQVNTQQK